MLNKYISLFKSKKNESLTILFLILTFYVIISRTLQIFSMLKYGALDEYWTPYHYAVALMFPVLSYLYYCSSQLLKGKSYKIKYFKYAYISCCLIAFCMLAQWVNEFAWRLLTAQSKFQIVYDNFPNAILTAMRAVTFYLPVVCIGPILFLLVYVLNDGDAQDAIKAINYFDNVKDVEPTGQLTCQVAVCNNAKTGKAVYTYENRRMEATLIQGATGTGKTATLMLPMCAQDLEKKHFFREYSKELGYKALEAGLAYIDAPISNKELTEKFNLKYLKPFHGKEQQFKEVIKDMIKCDDKQSGEILYRDLGITVVEPDGEYISNMQKVAKNFKIDVITVDPLSENTVGINPFINKSPTKVASIIATVLKGMFDSENPGGTNQFFGQVTQQALENLSIILKVMYPRMHGGALPTLEDMLKMLYDYNIVEMMCDEMKKDAALASEYKILIGYFEKNFYKPPLNDRGFPIPGTVGSGRRETEQFLYGATTQLDNLMRNRDVKRILCSRTNNIDFDDVLANGRIVTCCTRRGQLGSLLSKPFGMFFILSMQDAVLRRPGNENIRVPHFLYIDEFPDFVNKETETCFTLFRKYRCGMIVAIQNLSQLERVESMAFYKQVVVSNTKTQLIFGDTNAEDSKYWSDVFGKYETWKMSSQVQITPLENLKPGDSGYSENNGISISYTETIKPHLVNSMAFKTLFFRTKDSKGRVKQGKGKTNFLDSKYTKPFELAEYNFEKYLMHIPTSNDGPSTQSIYDNTENLSTSAIYSTFIPTYAQDEVDKKSSNDNEGIITTVVAVEDNQNIEQPTIDNCPVVKDIQEIEIELSSDHLFDEFGRLNTQNNKNDNNDGKN